MYNLNVYRLSSTKYSKTLSASGKSSRWNKDSEFVIYSGESRSLAMLESIVHRSIHTGLEYETMVISISINDDDIIVVDKNELPKNWRDVQAYPKLQEYGSKWYQRKKSLVLKVPSVIVPEEFNFIINTSHPFYTSKIKLFDREKFILDKRLQI